MDDSYKYISTITKNQVIFINDVWYCIEWYKGKITVGESFHFVKTYTILTNIFIR